MGLYKIKGSTVWHMSYTDDEGVQQRKSAKTKNKKIAQLKLSKIELEIKEGTYQDYAKGKKKTFQDMVDRYLKEVTPNKKPSTQRDDKRYGEHLAQVFGKYLLRKITPDIITQYVLQRKKQKRKGSKHNVGSYTINRELAFMSAAFNKAIKLWRWCKENPVSKVSREKEVKRVKYFKEDEFSKIYNLLPDWVKPIVLLGKHTGLRLSNLVNLGWHQIDLEQQLIILEAEVMKNSKTLGLPLNEVAMQVILNQKASCKLRKGFVFDKGNNTPYSVWGTYRAFKSACKDAGYPDFRFHDLRHDFCSKLVQKGISIYVVKELAGHKDVSTTQRYAHLNQDQLKEAVGVLNYQGFIKVDQNEAMAIL